MKKLILIGCLMLTNICYAQDRYAEKWRNDLNYLIQRIEIMHPNPYAFFPKEDFYKLKEKLSNEIPKLSDVDIVISISELLASLKDGHTRLGFEFSDPQWLDQNLHLLPFILYPFEDGIYIMAGISQYKEFVGRKVLEIGNIMATDAASKLGKLFSYDNQNGERKNLYYTLGFAEMLKKIGAIQDVNQIELTLQNENEEEIKVQIPTVSFLNMAIFLGTWYPQSSNGLNTMNEKTKHPLPLWLKNRGKSFWYEYIPENKMMFLQINSLNFSDNDKNEEETFSQLCTKFFDDLDKSAAEKLVIDIRANTGGNHVELPLLKGIISRTNIDQLGKLFLITGRVTYSAAVHFTTIFKKYTNVIIVGEPTTGRPNHYGAIRKFNLPNHPQIFIGCSIDYYQDSEPFNFNTAIVPDIEAKMTSTDYSNNIDPSLIAVRNYEQTINWVNILELELEKEYTNKGLDEVKKIYNSKKQELLNSSYNLEKFLTGFYNQCLYKNKKSKADLIDYLTFAVSECPESIDLCYSFAVKLEAEKRFDEAKIQYNRCLHLNYAHHYARMKLDLLELSEKTQ